MRLSSRWMGVQGCTRACGRVPKARVMHTPQFHPEMQITWPGKPNGPWETHPNQEDATVASEPLSLQYVWCWLCRPGSELGSHSKWDAGGCFTQVPSTWHQAGGECHPAPRILASPQEGIQERVGAQRMASWKHITEEAHVRPLWRAVVPSLNHA